MKHMAGVIKDTSMLFSLGKFPEVSFILICLGITTGMFLIWMVSLFGL